MASSDDKGSTVIGVILTFEVFALVALALRFWALFIVRRKMYAHDYFSLVGFFLSTALAGGLISSVVHGGLGQHASDLAVTPWKFITFGKLLIAVQILWAFSMTFVRLSILTLYIYIFSSHKRFRLACYLMMIISLLWDTGDTLTVFLLCRPLAYNWDKVNVAGVCGNLDAAYLAVHASNFAIDTSIALLPTPVLWNLQIPLKKKIGITAIFALGALVCAISIARIALYQLIVEYGQNDFTWSGTTLYIFTGVEPLIACTISCLPLLRPVGGRITSSTPISWAMSLISTFKDKKSTQNSSTLGATDSSEGLNGNTFVTIGGTPHRQWKRLNDNDRRIHVGREFELRSIEMKTQTQDLEAQVQ
ncbi:hypothetical protein NUW58_g272 [Xylaria curta]|uniref:Uncharacterized protein n=1 Tax=Xylaria curta TaxID=42375 RepID=A0ACC1PR03_9PEZI|nr:hypothetical protein NUW58_g272 [Xylaria curta]